MKGLNKQNTVYWPVCWPVLEASKEVTLKKCWSVYIEWMQKKKSREGEITMSAEVAQILSNVLHGF